jgi:inosine-uridine nucleoside N-ribohydrolase
MKHAPLLLLLSALLFIGCGHDAPRPLIFDTDWWTDVDDACAVRILLNADRSGVVDVLGVCLSAVDDESYESLGKFLAYEGYPDLPVGADKEGTDFLGTPTYRAPILEGVDAAPLTDSDVEGCVSFYRRRLAGSRTKVDIVAVGFTNTLSLLLQSKPDRWSRLTGTELVREKVGTLYLMAGNYPEGEEHNFCLVPRSREAGAVVCAQWPGEIVFLGFEVGVQVVAGGGLPHDDLLYQVLEAHGSADGRYMWDPLTLVIALQGTPAAAGFGEVRGTNRVDPATGANRFEENPAGPHRYVTLLHDPSWYSTRLDTLLRSRTYLWPSE